MFHIVGGRRELGYVHFCFFSLSDGILTINAYCWYAFFIDLFFGLWIYQDKARKATGMQIDVMQDDYTDHELFSLSSIKVYFHFFLFGFSWDLCFLERNQISILHALFVKIKPMDGNANWIIVLHYELGYEIQSPSLL